MTPDPARAPATAREPGITAEPIRRRAPLVPARATSTNQGLDLTVGFLAAIGLYGALGWMADGWLGTTPWLLAVGLALGFACGLYLLAVKTRTETPSARLRSTEIDDMERDTA